MRMTAVCAKTNLTKRVFLICITTLILLWLFPLSSCSLTPNGAKKDIQFLADSITSIHPEPFRHVSEEDFAAIVQSEIDSIDESIDKRQLWLKVSKILALLNDDHAKTDAAAMDIYKDYAKKDGALIPLLLYYSPEGQVLIRYDININDKTFFKKGDVLVSIDGKPIENVFNEMTPYIAGTPNPLERKRCLARGFCVYYWLINGKVEKFDIEILRNGELKQVTADAKVFKNGKANKKQPLYNYKFYEDGKICFFKFQNYNRMNMGKFESSFNKMVADIDSHISEYLIVDLRGNGGGYGPLGNPLERKILNKEYVTGSKRWRYSKAYRNALAEYGPRAYAGIRFGSVFKYLHLEKFYTKWPDPKNVTDGEWLIYPSRKHAASPDAWDKKLILLCDRGTHSAAVSLATTVKDNKLGLILGEETGGSATYNGEITPLYLPASDFHFTLPSAKCIRPSGIDDGRGVLPDIEIDPTLDDDEIVSHVKLLLQTHDI